MNLFKHFKGNEKGQVLILSLIILAAGCLTVTPLLTFMATGVKSTIGYQDKMEQSYACDAGIEDAAYRMLKDHPSIQSLNDGHSYTYTLESINGMPVTVTITKLCLLDGLLGSDEYKAGQPHENWVQYEIPTANITRNYEEDWVEYCCSLSFEYAGEGNRMIKSVGMFFAPFPGDDNLIVGPYDEVVVPIITLDNIERIEKKVAAGGFALIYRWLDELGPQFTKHNNTGSLYCKFRVNDADWYYTSSFVWASFKEQDVSYVTNAELNKWLIQANAGQITTRVQAVEDESSASVEIMSWGRN
jgi:hypothetical protein